MYIYIIYMCIPDEKPIPRFIFDNPIYLEVLEDLVRAANLDALSVPLRLPKYKQLIREAARIARNETLANDESETQARCTICPRLRDVFGGMTLTCSVSSLGDHWLRRASLSRSAILFSSMIM